MLRPEEPLPPRQPLRGPGPRPACSCGLAQRPRGSHHLIGCELIAWERSIPPLFGGWTPTYEGDMCKGGHPGPQHLLNGRPTCNRCGRHLDLRRCLCGEETHRSGLSRSFCSNRMRFDQRDAEDHAHMFNGE